MILLHKPLFYVFPDLSLLHFFCHTLSADVTVTLRALYVVMEPARDLKSMSLAAWRCSRAVEDWNLGQGKKVRLKKLASDPSSTADKRKWFYAEIPYRSPSFGGDLIDFDRRLSRELEIPRKRCINTFLIVRLV